jgi:hypothetical protein
MQDQGDLPKLEFKTYPLESWGQMLKVSADLSPEMFPQRVAVPIGSRIVVDLKDKILAGPGGRAIEHSGVVGVNDIGELMIGSKIVQGDTHHAWSEKTTPEMHEYLRLLKKVPLPPGWRTIGVAHSHPIGDVSTLGGPRFSRDPNVNGISVRLSGGDYRSLLSGARYGHRGYNVGVMINDAQITFMIATGQTTRLLREQTKLAQTLTSSKSSTPEFNTFEEMGVVLYAGNYFDKKSGDIVLERLK